jgi:hypothetical protein
MKAMKEMHGKYVGNRPIRLSRSTWKDRSILHNDSKVESVKFKKNRSKIRTKSLYNNTTPINQNEGNPYLNYNDNNNNNNFGMGMGIGSGMGLPNQNYNQGEMQMNHYSQMNNNIIIQNQNNYSDFNYLNYNK